jgi:hypothetical protein
MAAMLAVLTTRFLKMGNLNCRYEIVSRQNIWRILWRRLAERGPRLGVAAEATPRQARGQGIAGLSMALVKLRARLRTEGTREITQSDRRTNQQGIAVAHG